MNECGTCSASFSTAGLKRHRCSPERDREIVRRYHHGRGQSITEISRALGIGRGLVQRVLDRQRVSMRPPGRDRRERAPEAKPNRSGEPHPEWPTRCFECRGLLALDGSHVCA